MSLHPKCKTACFGLRYPLGLDWKNCTVECHLQDWLEIQLYWRMNVVRFCVQNEQNASDERDLRNTKVKHGWV